MGKFLSQLEIDQVTDVGESGRGSWQLIEPLSYQADSGVTYTAPAGFKTDLASVPRLPIVFWLFGDRCNESGALHDYLYSIDPKTKQHPIATRLMADQLLKEMIIAQGISSFVAECFYLGVRLGGGSHWA